MVFLLSIQTSVSCCFACLPVVPLAALLICHEPDLTRLSSVYCISSSDFTHHISVGWVCVPAALRHEPPFYKLIEPTRSD